jgi:hypothetical protein
VPESSSRCGYYICSRLSLGVRYTHMELLALLFIWPFLILAFGLVFIAFSDLALGGGGMTLFILALILVLVMLARSRNQKGPAHDEITQLKELRRMVVALSIAALLPIFVRYMFDAYEHTLPIIIIGLILGFGIILWGMFEKNHKVLMYSNILGGAMVVVYVYSQLWELGGIARVVAAAVGLVIAVVVSSIKLKEKLT